MNKPFKYTTMSLQFVTKERGVRYYNILLGDSVILDLVSHNIAHGIVGEHNELVMRRLLALARKAKQ